MLQRLPNHLKGRKLVHRQGKPVIFPMSGFILSYTANRLILMILYDFCLLPAQVCYTVVYIWKVESGVQIADRCAPWKISNDA
jgi:hypothetical protein